MVDRQNNSSLSGGHSPAFYQVDAEFNKGVCKVFGFAVKGAIAGSVLSVFLKGKGRAIWTGAGFGAGYGYCEAFGDYKRFQLNLNR